MHVNMSVNADRGSRVPVAYITVCDVSVTGY